MRLRGDLERAESAMVPTGFARLVAGEPKDAGDHFEYGGTARAVSIPATLRDSLMARLDRFMPVKEIARIGAAIGREFTYELIAAVAPMSQAQLDDALARLSQSGLAFEPEHGKGCLIGSF
jgi:predicted ATPase